MFNKISRAILVSLFVLAAPACSLFTPKAPPPSPEDIEREEQAVYSFFVGNQPALLLETTSIGFLDYTPEEVKKYIRSEMSGVSNEAIDNFLDRNAQSSQLSPDMDLGIEYVLLTKEELKDISSQPNWGEILSQRYPNTSGYKVFSRVGFNNTLDQAIISVGEVWGPLAGSGTCYLLEKQNGEWFLMEELMLWIS